ncbi:MAG: hypothetical protein WC389_18500 [Lutibacter sp.]|jgi:hypothetical protein
MAGIDKTYIDGKEYPLYRQWWIDNYDKMIKEFGDYIWLYTFTFFDVWPEEVTPEFLKENTGDIEYFKNKYDFPIWNTSEKKDKWLVKNCDIQSFRERMLEVYPYNWKGFKGQKWIPKPNKKVK